MTTTIIVDRSLLHPDHIPTLFETRNLLVTEVARQLGPRLAAVIAYSEVARQASVEEAAADGPDFVYGANLQHALLMARATARTTRSDRLLLLTYSLPTAHHTGGTQPFFMEPPTGQSLAAARREAVSATEDGLHLDILTIVPNGNVSRSVSMADYFGPMAETAGGAIESVVPGQDVEPMVRQLL